MENSHANYEKNLQQLTETIPLLFQSLNPPSTRSLNSDSHNSHSQQSKNRAGTMTSSPLPTQMVISIPQSMSNSDFRLNNNNNNNNNSNNNNNNTNGNTPASGNNLRSQSMAAHSQVQTLQQKKQANKQLRIQKLSLDLIRLKAEQETHQLLHPDDPTPQYMAMQIKQIQDKITALQNGDDNNESTSVQTTPYTIPENGPTNSNQSNQQNGNNQLEPDMNNGAHHNRNVSRQTELVGLLEQQVKSRMFFYLFCLFS